MGHTHRVLTFPEQKTFSIRICSEASSLSLQVLILDGRNPKAASCITLGPNNFTRVLEPDRNILNLTASPGTFQHNMYPGVEEGPLLCLSHSKPHSFIV